MDLFRRQWTVAARALGTPAHVAQQCVHFAAKICDAHEEVASLTHALVLLERLLVRGHTPSQDDLRGCVLLAVQMTVDENLATTTELRLLLGAERELIYVQINVLESLDYRVVVSRSEFVVYRNALSAIP